MPRSLKGGRGSGDRTSLTRLLPILPVIVLLIPVQSLAAAIQVSSGTAQLGTGFSYGTTSYSVDYSYPSTAEVGSNFTIATSLHVDSLSGQIQYITGYRIELYVFIGAQLVGNGSVAGTLNAYLYPGGTWGPNNVTIPLTPGNTGISKGQSANATVSLLLEDQIFVANGRQSYYTNEPPMQGAAGDLDIHYPGPSTTSSSSAASQGAGQSYVPGALVASGVVVLLLAVAVWPRSRPGSGATPK